MRKAVPILAGALILGSVAWWAASRQATVVLKGEAPPVPAEQAAQAPVQETPEVTVVEAVPPTLPAEPLPAEEEPVVEAEHDYGIGEQLRSKLYAYREAPTVAEREDPLLDLALSDDPGVLPFLLDEIHKATPANREQVLYAMAQYGSRGVIPELRKMARETEDLDERKALIDTADYLALPSFTEQRLGLWKPGDPAPTN